MSKNQLKNEYMKKWYRKNREKVIAYQKAHYHFRRATEPGYKNYKDETRRIYSKNYYATSTKSKDMRSRLVEERRELIRQIKDTPCKDCGIKYPPYVMQFDHRDPKEKIIAVSSMTFYSKERFMNEFAKCDVVCANCHAIRTHKQRLAGFFRRSGFLRDKANNLAGSNFSQTEFELKAI